ncbi:ArpU family phage packaging/lysis transcriptional regulator [Pediococcus pentosaceus]|uniref:ArpU family phage packaging/lysis transcriptional regulator n=1 Tax=Pediococcus pentosaceus TaxID=1255 RepID=UPI000D008BCB|nr:ArpU family phage packaging/lysis transcriptional regulator [Pediococcus pentosaceus]AVL02851.1 hypothetical protein PP40703_08630 [Pediococcus pentosaceus]MBF7133640.1 hypothetical protein [Pediococcus pentosaceus]QPT36976.1 hypothetical protein I6G30_03475 [Pediococcus pentosaceus]
MEQVMIAADKELKKCRKLMRIAGKRLSDLQSLTISDMPSSSMYGNKVEDCLISQIDAQIELEEIYRAITWLSDDEQKLIFAKYFDRNKPSDRMIMDDLYLSEGKFYRRQNMALKDFAESFMGGRLFKNAYAACLKKYI